MSRHLQRIKDYNLKYGFTQEQLKAMVEEGSNLELIIDRVKLTDGFIIHLIRSGNEGWYYMPTRIGELCFYYLFFEDLGTGVINDAIIKKKKTENKSYGENDVILYLFDIFRNRSKYSDYAGSFVVRHGIESRTYLALRKHDAIHNLQKAENYNKFLNTN